MAKTREMAKVSAENHAKTRGGKARARNGEMRLVMDSVTIPSPARLRKKKPTNVPPPIRQPSPMDPGTAGPPPADSIKREDILNEGWLLLKGYMGDEGVSAGQVSDFLEAVSEPELDGAFREIMGCDPDDFQRQQELAEMVESKLKELDTQALQPPCTEEESASRPYMNNFTGPTSTPTDTPTPYGVNATPHAPTSSPTTPRPFRTTEIPSSSAPPSSPSPVVLAGSLVEQGLDLDEGTPGNTVEQPTADTLAGNSTEQAAAEDTSNDTAHVKEGSIKVRREKLLALVAQKQASAVAQKRSKKKKLVAEKGKGRGKTKALVVAKVVRTKAKEQAKGKGKEKEIGKEKEKGNGKGKDKEYGKGKTREIEAGSGIDASEDDQEDDDDDDVAEKKRGRLSKDVKAQALALRERYHKELEALATKEGKTVGALLQAVGDVVQDNRGLNRWNAFQSYAIHPTGLNMERKEGQTEKEFKDEIRTLYCQKRDGNEEEFDTSLEWYRKMVAAQTTEKRLAGLTEKELQKLALPFINRVGDSYQYIVQ